MFRDPPKLLLLPPPEAKTNVLGWGHCHLQPLPGKNGTEQEGGGRRGAPGGHVPSPTRRGPHQPRSHHHPALGCIPPTGGARKSHPSTQAAEKTHPSLRPPCLLPSPPLFPLHLLPETQFKKPSIKVCAVGRLSDDTAGHTPALGQEPRTPPVAPGRRAHSAPLTGEPSLPPPEPAGSCQPRTLAELTGRLRPPWGFLLCNTGA